MKYYKVGVLSFTPPDDQIIQHFLGLNTPRSLILPARLQLPETDQWLVIEKPTDLRLDEVPEAYKDEELATARFYLINQTDVAMAINLRLQASRLPGAHLILELSSEHIETGLISYHVLKQMLKEVAFMTDIVDVSLPLKLVPKQVGMFNEYK